MSEIPLNPRQRREKAHYDLRYSSADTGASVFPPREAVLLPIRAPEQRAYLPGWQFVQTMHRWNLAGKAVLDLGCGCGTLTHQLVEMGACVTACDLSEQAIEATRARLRHYGLEDRVLLKVAPAEATGFNDGTFDYVVGEYILHHVKIDETALEIARLLRPRGRAAFLEWVRWRPFDVIRSHPSVRRLFPPGRGDVTEDERKIDGHDLDVLRSHFQTVELTKFLVFGRLAYFSPRLRLARLDDLLCRRIPGLRNAGGQAIIVLAK